MSTILPIRPLSAGEVARFRAWHKDLLDKSNRGERARLRRAHEPEQAALLPAFHRLVHVLEIPNPAPEVLTHLAALAMLAARIDLDTVGRPLGQALGKQLGKKEPKVSESRFRRLLESQGLKARRETLRRLLEQLERAADLREIGAVIFDWSPERRRQLAYDYYSGFAQSSDSKEEKNS